MNAVLILNHAAGSLNGERGAVSPEELHTALLAAGVNASLRLAAPKQMCAVFAAAIAERPDAIFVGGGDGTISAAAGCLAESGIPLGVLPLGTLNHFARDLGLSRDWREAVKLLARGHPRPVDVGEINGRVFINNCSVGAYATAVRQRDALRRQRGLGKWWAMTLATLAEFRRLRRLRVRIETPRETVARRSPFVLIANNAYVGRVLDSSLRPQLDEGLLWIYTTRAHRRLTLLRLAWQTLTRKIDEADGLEKLAVTAATIVSERGTALPLAIDGELADVPPPLRVRIRRRALLVLAPPEKPDPK